MEATGRRKGDSRFGGLAARVGLDRVLQGWWCGWRDGTPIPVLCLSQVLS